MRAFTTAQNVVSSSAWQQANFGEELIAALHQKGAVGQAAARVAQNQKVRDALGEQMTTAEVQRRAHVLLARRFLGELNRAFAYADGQSGWTNLNPLLANAGEPLPATPTP